MARHTNREFIRAFIEEILIGVQIQKISHFFDAGPYTEHNPGLADGLSSLHSALTAKSQTDDSIIQYEKLHKLLGEESFVLSASKGHRDAIHTSFYDLYRLVDGKIVEHWGTTEAIPPRSEWRNENGRF